MRVRRTPVVHATRPPPGGRTERKLRIYCPACSRSAT
jgi:hypothetical protein